MNKLLNIFLLALVFGCATQASLGQSSPPQAGATQPSESTEQAAALKEANSLSGKVVELYRAGKFDEALPIAENVLSIRERVLPANDRRIAEALSNIASLQYAKGETDKAEKLYARALAIDEATGDKDSAFLLTLLKRLVLVSATKRDFDKAESLAQRIVGIAEKKYKPEQLETAIALVDLAEVYRLQRDNKRARTLYARIVDILEKFAPASIPKEITLSLSNYLNLLYVQENGKDSDLTERIRKLFIAVASSAPPGAAREVQGGVLNGKAVYKPQPEYPASAKSVRAQGVVTVQVIVDETGKVIEAKATRYPHLSLVWAAEEAALRARFTPTLLSGSPVKVRGIITYNFLLF
ncbi:MAG TPA: TonB family protein [Pyrinomonadaceae bacterium]|jgi:TonB family protein|nr:TonB family protein [Pyrinomonadaceae bacterium]